MLLQLSMAMMAITITITARPADRRQPTKVPATDVARLTTMRKMDLLVEGVFRKNGNIKRLHDTMATIGKEGRDAVDFTKGNVVRIGAFSLPQDIKREAFVSSKANAKQTDA